MKLYFLAYLDRCGAQGGPLVHWEAQTAAAAMRMPCRARPPRARSKGPVLQHFVMVQLVQLLCRTIKLGWFDHEAHR